LFTIDEIFSKNDKKIKIMKIKNNKKGGGVHVAAGCNASLTICITVGRTEMCELKRATGLPEMDGSCIL
jgi:hypothetical protein